MKVLVGIAALFSVGALVAAGGSSRRANAPLRRQIATAVRELTVVMQDSLPVKTARVYGPASYQVALQAWDPGFQLLPRERALKGSWYVIVVPGRFIYAGPFRASRGSLAMRVWSPSEGNSGIGHTGIADKLPASMARLGLPAVVNLH